VDANLGQVTTKRSHPDADQRWWRRRLHFVLRSQISSSLDSENLICRVSRAPRKRERCSAVWWNFDPIMTEEPVGDMMLDKQTNNVTSVTAKLLPTLLCE
jgi:hypothetical protein